MATVLLLGFSCAGKSFFADKVVERWPQVRKFDSDSWIAEPYDGHIHNIFFAHGRDEALDVIEQRDGLFLDHIEPSDEPRIIAAGPALPSRDHWSSFVERVTRSFVYLVQTPEEVLVGLRERSANHKADPTIAEKDGFASWDQGVTTRAISGNRWEEVDDSTALTNIAGGMRLLVGHYEHLTPVEHRYLVPDIRQESGRDRLLADIGSLLGVD